MMIVICRVDMVSVFDCGHTLNRGCERTLMGAAVGLSCEALSRQALFSMNSNARPSEICPGMSLIATDTFPTEPEHSRNP